MRVVYSMGARFAGGGIGTTSYHAVCGLHRHGTLRRLLCGSFRSTELPTSRIRSMGVLSRLLRKLAVYDKSRRINHLYNVLYDRWAARHVEACDVFDGWGGFCLRSLRKAHALGAVTVVERASSHPRYQHRLLREEYARWGMAFSVPARALQQAVAEIEYADYVLIPSDFVRASFLEEGVSPSKLLQVPLGVDVERFRPKVRDDSRFRVLFVGQVSIRKGVPYLLKAWQQLGWDDAELWLVGRIGRNAAEAFSVTQVRGVRQLGYVDDPVRLYQQTDVFVFPTIEEGSALVTYEAMASGLPVITTPHAGSLVRDGKEGFIVPIRDAEALAARMEDLRSDATRRRHMGVSARRRIEPFTWRRYGDTLVETLKQVL